MLTLRQLFDDHLALLGFETGGDSSPLWARDRALADIRAALQLMQAGGPEYYGRETIQITLVDGQSQYTLSKSVQTVIGSARIADATLRKLDSRSQVNQFGQLFLGRNDNAQATGTPIAYFAEVLRDSTSDEADNVSCVLHVAPTPAAGAGTLKLDVITEPVELTDANLCDSSSPPVPHKYHETILRPLVRWNATKSPLFTRRELLGSLQDDYARALGLLGLSDPNRTNSDPTAVESRQPRQQQEAA